MKNIFIAAILLLPVLTKAQNIQNIFVNLYTDSLKKGTYNYINIDGLLSNGNYTPLDSSAITFWANEGKFYGNSLLISKDFKKDKVLIKVHLKSNPSIAKEFTLFIKKNEDAERLKTTEELMGEMQNNPKKGKKRV